MRFAANLTLLFTELPFLERFQAAADAGFDGVEILFPYSYDLVDVQAAAEDAGMPVALINAPPGNWAEGERGLAALPGRNHEFEAALDTACRYIDALKCPTLHVMAGIVPEGVNHAPYWATYIQNLQRAADAVAPLGAQVSIEPLNTRDMPNYLLNNTSDALRVLEELNASNIGLQYDVYHCQIMEGDLTRSLETLMSKICHLQISSVPDRHEPDQGEVQLSFLFDRFKEALAKRWIGCEYHPSAQTTDNLDWLTRFKTSR